MKTATKKLSPFAQAAIEATLILTAVFGMIGITASYFSGPITHFLNQIS